MTQNPHTANDGSDTIVGIDLGTTNSAAAIYENGEVRAIEIGGSPLLPSYVGLSPSNELMTGRPALNQYILYPERTVKSVKRRMGGTEPIELGGRSFLPEEISALILGRLKSQAEASLGKPIHQAVITVPAYFNDTQRQATRAAGEIAGLKVARIFNEPTAASLAFRNSVLPSAGNKSEISAVYDLGGGTFDVSIVREENDVTEVLASHGDTRLGGDDFDRMILDHFLTHIQQEYKINLRENRRTLNRLTHAAEDAKIELSAHPFVHVVEEDLGGEDGPSIHLDLELTRDQYEEMIRSKINQTIECVEQALRDAKLSPSQVDNVLLVGGSTRTPLVREVLKDLFQKEPRSEVHPDMCVVMGAALLAARIQGLDVERILVDITSYTFGVAAVHFEEDGYPNPHFFSRIIPRNTPLPVTRSNEYSTMVDNQEAVQIDIYQGEDDDVRYNTKIGTFRVEGLSKAPAGNVVIDRMSLDLNGILTVTSVEKRTGLQKSIKIEGAYQPKKAEDIADSRSRLAEIIALPLPDKTGAADAETEEDSIFVNLSNEHREVLNKARSVLDRMHPDDKEEAEALCAQIERLASEGKEYEEPLNELQELLYFVGE